MAFQDIIEFAKIQAIKDKFLPNELSVFKSFCRSYSEKFHVPLPQAYLLDPIEVLGAVFASQLEDIEVEDNLESLLEQIYSIQDPNYENSKEEEFLEFVEQIKANEQEKNEKRLLKQSKKTNLEIATPEPKIKPTGGTVDFSSLSDKNEK